MHGRDEARLKVLSPQKDKHPSDDDDDAQAAGLIAPTSGGGSASKREQERQPGLCLHLRHRRRAAGAAVSGQRWLAFRQTSPPSLFVGRNLLFSRRGRGMCSAKRSVQQ